MFYDLFRVKVVEFFIATSHVTRHAVPVFVVPHQRPEMEPSFVANAAFHFVKQSDLFVERGALLRGSSVHQYYRIKGVGNKVGIW